MSVDTEFNISSVLGTSQDDTLIGTGRSEVLSGAGGNDEIQALSGKGKVFGGRGNDVLYGQGGKSAREEISHFTESTCRPDRRLRVHICESAPGMVRAEGQVGLAGNRKSAPLSIREDGHRGFFVRRELVDIRVLAVRLRTAGGSQAGKDSGGVPAHAVGRELQPRSSQEAG